MSPTEFDGQNVVFAKDQPEYRPLPAWRANDSQGTMICCWKLTWRERLAVLVQGRIWHTVLTFNQPLQPQLLEGQRPGVLPRAKP
jgi:hypothetical protein